MALGFLPGVIGKFSDQHPNVSVSLQIRSSTKVMEWIASQLFDVGFAAVQQDHPAVEQELLLDAPFVAVMPRNHPLARKRKVVPADFADESFISLGPELGTRTRIDEVFETAGVVRRTAIDTQLSAAVCRMVAEGGGLSLIEPITAWQFCDHGIEARPFEPRLTFKYSLLYPAYRARSRLAETFVALVREELAGNPLLP
jgi:DNA-binding transcriptional LysR family regulator